MRRAAKVDANQAAIVDALRAEGASVVHISHKGVPDLLVGHEGVTYLLEVKNADGRNRLTADQIEFHKTWRGAGIWIVHTPEQALDIVLD